MRDNGKKAEKNSDMIEGNGRRTANYTYTSGGCLLFVPALIFVSLCAQWKGYRKEDNTMECKS